MSFIDKRIKDTLTRKNIEFEEIEHEAARSSEESARATGLQTAKNGVKAMIFRTDKQKYLLVLNPGDQRVDTKAIAKMEQTKHLELAKPDEVLKVAGTAIGCIPPFGHQTRLRTYLNEQLPECEYVFFSSGIHTKTIKIKGKDLLKLIEEPIIFG